MPDIHLVDRQVVCIFVYEFLDRPVDRGIAKIDFVNIIQVMGFGV